MCYHLHINYPQTYSFLKGAAIGLWLPFAIYCWLFAVLHTSTINRMRLFFPSRNSSIASLADHCTFRYWVTSHSPKPILNLSYIVVPEIGPLIGLFDYPKSVSEILQDKV